MEWVSTIRQSLDYIESHLKEKINVSDISKVVYMSSVNFQKGFEVMTGYTVSEYIRNRRLYLAALQLKDSDKKVIDVALDYGYETPESFTKAFQRFHSATPTEIKAGKPIKTFLPLTIKFDVSGGDKMDVKIRNLFGFKVIGFAKKFNFENSYEEIPKFWDEICEKYAANVYAGNPPANEYEKALMDNCIGEYGICIEDQNNEGEFLYLIAGKYSGGEVPEGMMLYEFEKGEWAIFDCIGPIPNALQTLNTRIFKEWLPGNLNFEISGNANVEWYDCLNGEKSDPDYHSAIWIPVKRK